MEWLYLVNVVCRTVYYGEYNCYGLGANRAKRVRWSRDQSAPYFKKDIIGARSCLRPVLTHFKKRGPHHALGIMDYLLEKLPGKVTYTLLDLYG